MENKNLTADTLFKTSKSEKWKNEHDNILGIFSNNVNKNQNQGMILIQIVPFLVWKETEETLKDARI